MNPTLLKKAKAVRRRVRLNAKQKLILSKKNRNRFQLYHGSVRSGKTIFANYEFLRRMHYLSRLVKGAEEAKGINVAVGRTKNSVFRNVLAPMLDDSIFPGYAKHITGSRGKEPVNGADLVHFFGIPVYIMGAHDKTAEANIRGATVNTFLIDELTKIHQEFGEQIQLRAQKGYATTNPDRPTHWVYKEIILRARDPEEDHEAHGWDETHFNIFDNIFLKKIDLLGILNRFKSGLMKARFVDGEWTSASGTIFDMFNPKYIDDPDDPGNVIRHADMPPFKRILSASFDFGTTHPSAGVKVGWGVDNKLYVYSEWSPAYRDGKQIDWEVERRPTTGEQGASYVKWFNDSSDLPVHLRRNMTPDNLFYDHAAASIRVELETRGLYPQPADKRVDYGIEITGSRINDGDVIFSDNVPLLIAQMLSYSFMDDGSERPIKLDDDFVDALRYAIASAESEFFDQLASDLLRKSILAQLETHFYKAPY